MEGIQPIKVYLAACSYTRLKLFAQRYGVSASALGSLILIKFMQEKPEDLQQLLLTIEPFELSEED